MFDSKIHLRAFVLAAMVAAVLLTAGCHRTGIKSPLNANAFVGEGGQQQPTMLAVYLPWFGQPGHINVGYSSQDRVVMEKQIERFAPGFRDRVLARHTMNAVDMERYNPSFAGGAITGGVSDLGQLFTRPVARWNPYSTPNPRVFLCSAATPPGGGVHGMCGYYAARAAQRRMEKTAVGTLAG